jgi:hypothetical protein
MMRGVFRLRIFYVTNDGIDLFFDDDLLTNLF